MTKSNKLHKTIINPKYNKPNQRNKIKKRKEYEN